MAASVIIGWYGDAGKWMPLVERASASVKAQTVDVELIVNCGTSLRAARNDAAACAQADWLVFVDADDQIDPSFVERMVTGSADLRQPATLGVYPDGSEDPQALVIPPKRSILEGNWMVIGTMVRAELFHEAGGFGDEPAWEDWSLWTRCLALGATWEPIPEAIYRVCVNPFGRNSTVQEPIQLFKTIRDANIRWAEQRGLTVP